MSVKRYTPKINIAESSEDVKVQLWEVVDSDGRYVLYSDYAAILARHNALYEAVKKERIACEQIRDAIFNEDVSAWTKADDAYDAARAEVDRLLMGEK